MQPRENPGYASEFAHLWKNPAGAHMPVTMHVCLRSDELRNFTKAQKPPDVPYY